MSGPARGSGSKIQPTAALDQIVGGRVRVKRMEAGISQETLAKALGLTFQQVQKYEKGTNRISVGRLSQIAEALGTDTGYFMKGLSPSNGKPLTMTPYETFMTTREGVDIVEAMLGLDQELQRTVIDVARRLAPR